MLRPSWASDIPVSPKLENPYIILRIIPSNMHIKYDA